MRRKKIFFVANSKSVHTAKWINYFVEKGYDVHLATFSNENKTKCQNIYFLGGERFKASGGNYHYLLKISNLADIFRKVQPDIINAHYSYSMGLVALLAKKKARISCDFSVVCHGSDVLSPPFPSLFDRINRWVLASADKVFAVSDQIKDKVESFGITVERIFVGQYGIEIPDVSKIKDIDILSNRAYHPNSRIDFLLKSIAEMELGRRRIVFVVPNVDEKTYAFLQQKYPGIEFHKYIEYAKMVSFLSRTKVYISATRSDGTSLSLLEAMGTDCIPVVSNIVSNRSWVLDGVNGYLFDGEREFRSKLERALIWQDRGAEAVTDINRKLIRRKGDYTKQMKKIENFLMGNR